MSKDNIFNGICQAVAIQEILGEENYDTQAAAIYFQKQGGAFLPLHPNNKIPYIPLLPLGEDNKPNWKSFITNPPTTEVINNWFSKNGKINIGLITGRASRVVVIDIDGKKGLEYFQKYIYPLNPNINLWQFTSSSEKVHVFYKAPEDFDVPNSVNKEFEIDVRGEHGYIVFAPSIHPSTMKPYAMYCKHETFTGFDSLAEFTREIFEAISALKKSHIAQISTSQESIVPSTNPQKNIVQSTYAPIREGTRNDAIMRYCGSLYGKNLSQEEVLILARNKNAKCCMPALSDKEVESIVYSMHKTDLKNHPEKKQVEILNDSKIDELMKKSDSFILKADESKYLFEKKYNVDNFTFSKMYEENPPEMKYLVDKFIPLERTMLFVAEGGAGKSMLMLDLAHKVAGNNLEVFLGRPLQPTFLHMPILEKGKVLYLSGEDDKDEINRRTKNLGYGASDNIHLITMLDIGGGSPLFNLEFSQAVTTPLFDSLVKQTKCQSFKLIIIDTLTTFAPVNLDFDNIQAQFVMTRLNYLAKVSGAAIIVCHHTGKDGLTYRGASGLSFGGRGTIILKALEDKEPNSSGKVRYTPLSDKRKEFKLDSKAEVYELQIVKENSGLNRGKIYLTRKENGLLVPLYRAYGENDYAEDLNLLCRRIEYMAKIHKPLTCTGKNGLYARKAELPEQLRYSRQKLEDMGRELLAQKRIVVCDHTKKGTSRWLDVPDGPLAHGEYDAFELGSLEYAEQNAYAAGTIKEIWPV